MKAITEPQSVDEPVTASAELVVAVGDDVDEPVRMVVAGSTLVATVVVGPAAVVVAFGATVVVAAVVVVVLGASVVVAVVVDVVEVVEVVDVVEVVVSSRGAKHRFTLIG